MYLKHIYDNNNNDYDNNNNKIYVEKYTLTQEYENTVSN